MRTGWLLVLVVACAAPRTPDEKKAVALPLGFRVTGQPAVFGLELGPDKAWRALVSRLTTLRFDAAASGEDILVTLDPTALHATTRAGNRLTWLFPVGLRVEGGPVHLLLGGDLGTAAYAADGTQISLGEGVTVIRARIDRPSGPPAEFRLVVKAKSGFRSISKAG